MERSHSSGEEEHEDAFITTVYGSSFYRDPRQQMPGAGISSQQRSSCSGWKRCPIKRQAGPVDALLRRFVSRMVGGDGGCHSSRPASATLDLVRNLCRSPSCLSAWILLGAIDIVQRAPSSATRYFLSRFFYCTSCSAILDRRVPTVVYRC